jgi:hypothetical protein
MRKRITRRNLCIEEKACVNGMALANETKVPTVRNNHANRALLNERVGELCIRLEVECKPESPPLSAVLDQPGIAGNARGQSICTNHQLWSTLNTVASHEIFSRAPPRRLCDDHHPPTTCLIEERRIEFVTAHNKTRIGQFELKRRYTATLNARARRATMGNAINAIRELECCE